MLHFNITSTSANVQDLTERVRSGFENADLVLVQANGLRFEDNEITRGISITPNNNTFLTIAKYFSE